MRRLALLSLVALLPLLGLGCGYRFGAPSATLPSGVKEVAIPVLLNRTAEPQVEGLVTEALREYAARSGLLGTQASEAVLEGAVASVSTAPILSGPNRLPTYRLGMTVQLTLKRGERSLGQVVVTQTEDFPSGADVLLTESSRGSALRRLAELVAREAFERLAALP
jgi:Lipopolysaccharide-assembly